MPMASKSPRHSRFLHDVVGWNRRATVYTGIVAVVSLTLQVVHP